MITEELRTASDESIRLALAHADPMTLRGVLYHATGDESLRQIKIGAVRGAYAEVAAVEDEADIVLLKQKAFDLLASYRNGSRQPPNKASSVRLHQAVELAAGAPIPAEDMTLHLDMLSLDPTPRGWGEGPKTNKLGDFCVIVIGTGFAGINASVQLAASGIPFVVLEKNAGVGGTWFQNTYPGARVDWPSVLYSHSYGLGFEFQYPFAPQAHNAEYMDWCVDTYQLRSHIRFDTAVEELRWSEAEGLWYVKTRHKDGTEQTYQANAVISAIGLLERPNVPNIPGMNDFQGPKFHTTRFDHTIDYSDKRVAVIGTGASGMQLVPDLAQMAKHVTVFQRTPSWALPVPGYRDRLPADRIWLNRNFPYYANWTRFVFAWNLGDNGLYRQFLVDPTWIDSHSVNELNSDTRKKLIAYMELKLAEHPDLLRACTPNYPVFGTRPVIDNGWFDAIKRDNVTLVPAGPAKFIADAVVSTDGDVVPADVVIFATGFRPNEYFTQIKIIGRDKMNVEDLWKKDGPRAYWGVAVPKLPNLFIMYGPNANPTNLGPVQYGEWAMEYFLKCFKEMIENGWKSMEVTQEAYDKFNEQLDVRADTMVSVNARSGHKSYFTNDHGRSAVQSPWTSAEIERAFSRVEWTDYRVDKSTPKQRRAMG